MAEHIKATTLSETCPKCGDELMEILGPWGKDKKRDLVSGMHYAKVGCMGCRKHVRWSPWSRDVRDLLAVPGVTKCSCGDPIVWIATGAGKRMPLDFLGPPTLVVGAGGAMLAGRESHFASCPHADKHRKGEG